MALVGTSTKWFSSLFGNSGNSVKISLTSDDDDSIIQAQQTTTTNEGNTMNSFNCEQHIDEVMESPAMKVEYDAWQMQREEIDYSKLTLAEAQQLAWDNEDESRRYNTRLPYVGQKCRD